MRGARLLGLLVVALAVTVTSQAGAKAGTPKGVADATPRAVVTLRAESVLRRADIRLGDVAEIQGSDAAFVDRLREVEIGRAPLPGLSRTLDLPYLKSRLRLQQIDLGLLVLDAPAVISVTTAGQRVSGEELVAAVRAHILEAREAEREHLAVRATTLPPDFTLPAGTLELRVRMRRGADPLGSQSVSVEAWVDGSLIRTLSVPVKVTGLVEVLVASRPIARHAMLGPADVRLEPREVGGGQEPLRDLQSIDGLRALRPIHQGEVILSTLLEQPPLVRRGDLVRLTIEGRGLRAMAQGEAREEGKMGQVIRVRNLSSGREVYGQVDAERSVRVPF